MPRQVKSPSLAQDLLMLGDIYLTLVWLAVQRLRHGPLWPWEARSHGSIVVLPRPEQEAGQEHESVTPKRD